MPCLFFANVPPGTKFREDLVRDFHLDLAVADNAELGGFEIHIENVQYDLLRVDGSRTKAPNVHVFVEYFARSLPVKRKIAALIHRFLVDHGIGKDSDITFRDSPAGTFFLNGRLVEGGPPTIWQ
jgi:hypothetical protein